MVESGAQGPRGTAGLALLVAAALGAGALWWVRSAPPRAGAPPTASMAPTPDPTISIAEAALPPAPAIHRAVARLAGGEELAWRIGPASDRYLVRYVCFGDGQLVISAGPISVGSASAGPDSLAGTSVVPCEPELAGLELDPRGTEILLRLRYLGTESGVVGVQVLRVG